MVYRSICLLTLLILTTHCGQKEQQSTTVTNPNPQQMQVNEMPALNILKTDGQMVSLLDAGGKVVVIFYNPGCDHCEREAEQIKNRKQLFAGYQVYFISTESAEAATAFAKKYELTDANFIFAQADGSAVFESVGNLKSVPAIFIYDNKRLVKRFEGETSLDVLKQFL